MKNNMLNENEKIVTRFAPSPTGFLHVGGIRTALYAWIFARKNNGKFILRIEDTDKEREVAGSIEHIIKSLKWLGLFWDEGPDIGGPNGPYIQSKRLPIYWEYAKKLLNNDFAYADPYSENEIEQFRNKSEDEKKPFLFRDYRPSNPPQWDISYIGEKPILPLRLKVRNIKRYDWNDLVYGKLSAGPEALDDFILIKSDGYPTYNFAHIVDDIEMKVTHVIRGQEFISSVPKFLSLYESLEINPPLFATVPPIMGKDGKKKLGKRDGAKDFLEYEKDGILPDTMFNFLTLLGWHPKDDREILSRQEIINLFELERIQNSGAQFDEQKMKWMNKEYLKKLNNFDQKSYIESFLPKEIKEATKNNSYLIDKMVPILIERIEQGKDIEEMFSSGELNFYFQSPNYHKENLLTKNKREGQADYNFIQESILQSINILSQIANSDFNKDKIKEFLWDYATSIGRGDLLWAIRFALTGLDKSPDPFIVSEILGKDEVLKRLNKAINIINEK